ncbi:MAG: hypothetical protein ACYTG0_03430 [Planctomycetota bacterium]|jgi:hypothetical protein
MSLHIGSAAQPLAVSIEPKPDVVRSQVSPSADAVYACARHPLEGIEHVRDGVKNAAHQIEAPADKRFACLSPIQIAVVPVRIADAREDVGCKESFRSACLNVVMEEILVVLSRDKPEKVKGVAIVPPCGPRSGAEVTERIRQDVVHNDRAVRRNMQTTATRTSIY